MEIKRINDNQIRCAITEEEIEELGFHIDDIIGNTEVTQKFMRVILEKVEEIEDIDVTLLSPMVRAELLQDHSMAITFGGITEEERKGMLGRVMDMIEQFADKMGDKLASPEDVNDFLSELDMKPGKKLAKKNETQMPKATKTEVAENEIEGIEETEEDDIFQTSTPFALEFANLDEVISISKLFQNKDCVPDSSLYKMDEKYYLVMNFMYFSKKELRPFAFAAVEYNGKQFATEAGVAYIKEHGTCIIKEDAMIDLMQL